MNQPKERRYIDVEGKERHIKLVREVHPLHQAPWHIDLPTSTLSIWELSDGSQIQLPDAVWFDHEGIWKAPKQL